MTKTLTNLWNERRDALIGTLLFFLAFALYLRTLAPSVAFLFDDTLEFQYVVPRLGILHQTGYPFYTLLGKLFTLILPLNDPAFRLNLLSALNGALAVAMVYIVIRHLTAYRIAAIIGALAFAVGETFWAQAVIAETYTTQMLIVGILLYLTLIWREEFERGNADQARRRLYALAFMMGLGLTHHRLILLLYPAIAVYVLLVNRNILRDFKTLLRAAIFFLLPLLLYLYLPLRGNVGSADGTYENTLQGFIAWVMAQQYFLFLTSNPLAVQHDTAYYWSLFNSQFTLAGLALALIGILGLLRRPREWVLLVVALVAEAGFAFNYNTANVQVHFLTTFLLITLFLAAGIDAIFHLISNFQFPISKLILHLSSFVILLFIPAQLLLTNYPTNNLSQSWDKHDYGLDILSQPLENNATIIGIQGEMTLLRYFQENANLRPDAQTIAADKEPARLVTIASALKQNRVVYLTRQLPGAPEKYSLSSLGPLIRVLSKPATTPPTISHPLDEDYGAVKLIGYDLDTSRLNAIPNLWHAENGKYLRVTLYWQAVDKIETDAMVSIKILRSDQHVFGQIDHRPVLDAYPTTAWRPGEIIADTYDVPVFLGVTPSDYTISATMYDAQSGTVIGQTELTNIALDPSFSAPRHDLWNIAHTPFADFGALWLAGYSLDASIDTPIRPGDALPLTLLWRAGELKLPDNLSAHVWLEDSTGRQVASRDALISLGYPPFQWSPNMFVRDWLPVRLPANIADGNYSVKLAVSHNNQLLGSSLLPFVSTTVDLGKIQVKNRPRVMVAPKIAKPYEATFDNKIKLLGYAVNNSQVTLYWRALAPMDTPYTVFVHLIDANGKVVASGDAPPGNGEFPTTGWIENEYITDLHTLSINDVPPGADQIEMGWYDPVTGTRLKTATGQDRLLFPFGNPP